MGKIIGTLGERMAENFLADRGLAIIARNYHAGRAGEIDLIATLGVEIIFIEVKTRTKMKFSAGLEAVDGYKLKKWYYTAEDFILRHPEYENFHWRFDVVEIFLDWDRKRAKVKLVQEVY